MKGRWEQESTCHKARGKGGKKEGGEGNTPATRGMDTTATPAVALAQGTNDTTRLDAPCGEGVADKVPWASHQFVQDGQARTVQQGGAEQRDALPVLCSKFPEPPHHHTRPQNS